MKEFLNTRVRIVRHSDRSEHFGWIKGVDSHQFRIDLSIDPPLVAGESADLELVSPTFKALMPSVFCGSRENQQYFTIAKNYQVLVGKYDVRRKGLPGNCKVHVNGRIVDAELADASLYGLAVLCPESIEPTSIVQADLVMCEEVNWTTSVIAKVVYARIEPKTSSIWRIGMSLVQMNRLDATRWKSVLEASCHKECASFGNSQCTYKRLAA